MFGGDLGMSEAEFEALPESEQQRILVENMDRSEAREKERRKMARNGLSTSEFVQAFSAYNHAMNHVLTEESFPEAVTPLELGVRKDNVDLIRPMAEAEKLWSYLGG